MHVRLAMTAALVTNRIRCLLAALTCSRSCLSNGVFRTCPKEEIMSHSSHNGSTAMSSQSDGPTSTASRMMIATARRCAAAPNIPTISPARRDVVIGTSWISTGVESVVTRIVREARPMHTSSIFLYSHKCADPVCATPSKSPKS